MAIVARNWYDDRPVLKSDISFKDDLGLTKQADAKDADINNILKRYERTGELPLMIAKEARYGDFSDPLDYQSALNLVKLAEEQFNALEAHIRNRFDNDPAKFLAFATDPKNLDEMVKLGLAVRKPLTDAQKASEIGRSVAEALKSVGAPGHVGAKADAAPVSGADSKAT